MKHLILLWAGLWRKPARLIFTFLSVVAAFLLFGMLQGLNAGFAKVIADQHIDRLVTDPRVPGGAPIPIGVAPQILNVPGVSVVAARVMFVGTYQAPKNVIVAFATDPQSWFAVRPENVIANDQLDALVKTPTGIVVSAALLKQYAWKIGDRIPIQSGIVRQDGAAEWIFDLVGVFDNVDNPNRAKIAVINFKYFDEVRANNRGTADRFIERISNPERSRQVAFAIDKLFANSSHQTRTLSDREWTQSQLRQLGDVEYFTNAVVSAVFFALLFLTANTMTQSVRERIPEFAVLKTIGYSDANIFVLVLLEALCLCVSSAIIGLAIAAAVFPALTTMFGGFKMQWIVIISGVVLAALVALVSACIPALRVKSLRIVDAMSER